ncbi:MAG: polyphosphate polymerase domain-containing protein [Ignavibacteriae bacterium]|nr:polyphosphate polymerase domain-containing protein [Ignavibacteriota bacterium]MCB9208023.1 polyphosphate polymerase domain-containing protein [Ignavibacteriales bacterium]MCB9258792.1 polyphosphate polymerase domain-containing protein [Ignavibacteriales bacterium]
MRLEYKFLVNNSNLERLRKKILPFIEYDPFVKDGDVKEYTVRSIYFDSSNFDYYHEKIEGIKIRKKLRIRSYDNYSGNDLVFLEIKNKYENFIGKNRAPLLYHDLGNLLKTKAIETYTLTNNGYANSIQDGEKFLHHIFRSGLKPIILIVYEREAFFSKFDRSLRITFDKNLRFYDQPKLYNLYKDNDLEYATPNNFVLEIKFDNGYPKWMQEIVQEFNLQRRSVSKYTICIDSSKLINPMKKNLNSSNYPLIVDQNTEEGIF